MRFTITHFQVVSLPLDARPDTKRETNIGTVQYKNTIEKYILTILVKNRIEQSRNTFENTFEVNNHTLPHL